MLLNDLSKGNERYDSCRVSSFERSNDPTISAKQQAVIDQLTNFVSHLHEHVDAGGNVIFYGPTGTGKDHLLFALARKAIIDGGYPVKWVNGQDLAGLFRDAIDGGTGEEAIVRRFTHPQILAISDPIPPKGEASAYVTSLLYRIVDARYRQCKGTWVTINSLTVAEAANALSAPVFDRLRDNALTICCNWPSYRPANKPAWMQQPSE